MSVIEDYRSKLKHLSDWDAYLLQESHLPGPRSNLELLYACAELAPRTALDRWLQLTPVMAPENTPQCFLACCGVVGLGRLLNEGDLTWLSTLRDLASDPRWRIRESVCMALQRYGKDHMPDLLDMMETWATGNPFEQRAAAAALCEPALLHKPEDTAGVLELLNRITASIHMNAHRKQDDFLTLREGLAYCWSVAVAALPKVGKPLMETWLYSPDPDIRWLMKQNLKKNRLVKMDPAWVAQCISIL